MRALETTMMIRCFRKILVMMALFCIETHGNCIASHHLYYVVVAAGCRIEAIISFGNDDDDPLLWKKW